ncbi:hypothetical protein K440DRAFT_624058, partial [Wilcoxina mikolae CBS 423.85]
MSSQDYTPQILSYNLGRPVTPQQHQRRISSLQSLLDFNLSPEASHNDVREASSLLLSVINAYSSALTSPVTASAAAFSGERFRADYIIQHLCDLAPSAVGKANVIRQVLAHLYPPDEGCSGGTSPLREILPRARRGAVNPQEVFPRIDDFAQALLECFFVPFLAEGGKMLALPSRGSPLFLTSRSRIPSEYAQPGSERLPDLRRMCLARDNYRCVVTGWMDMRSFQSQQIAARNAGELASFEDSVRCVKASTVAAHIVPHALNRGESPGGGLSESNTFVWQVLEMFDPRVRLRLEGDLIDSPHNAIILQSDLHQMFGQLLFWFNDVPNEPHTYTIATARRIPLTHLAAHLSPDKRISFTDYSSEGVYLPDTRLLRLHAACAKILDMSGAAEYV